MPERSDTRPRDFSDSLHELRVREIATLPPGARTVLHGGAADSWYFRWFDENYPGTVEHHIGVEAFQEKPGDLPENVEWLARTLGDMGPVADGSVDLVFGGQVIEHLWPHDIAGLLLESHRVLRPGGHLVLDSPNRRVTEAIAWLHPQHTVELSVDEIVDLVTLAGFDVEAIRGVLLGYDAERHAFLGIDDLDELPVAWEDRAAAATERPEDSFIWWLVARRADRVPDTERVAERAQERFATFRAARLRRLLTPLPVVRETHAPPRVSAPADFPGPLLHGPYLPVEEGEWRARFALRLEGEAYPGGDAVVAAIDVASETGTLVHARRDVHARELDPGGGWTQVELDLALDEMTMGVELRAYSAAGVVLGAQLQVGLARPADLAGSPPPDPAEPARTPEPRTVELAAWLGRRMIAAGRRQASRGTRARS